MKGYNKAMPVLKPPHQENPLSDFSAWESDERICLKCGGALPEGFVAACGIKTPCPRCGHMYPLGDCSD
jgi:hypothetical protein